MDPAPRYSVLELCRNRAGYEAVPEKRMRLDLARVQATLERSGFTTLANAGIILVAKVGPVEMSVFESGKILVKTPYEDHARRAQAEFMKAMGWAT
ncbi:MAG TPA: hypothetical protein VM889_08770 [Candidatus Thermoplasmatota archaeon]|nr:hypothetical protein [Candidatus Thermoplasmatota archaeon]